MRQVDLEKFRRWFSEFVKSFCSDNSVDQKNIDLKAEHTTHVCENMRLISGSLGMSANELLIAESAALFHDIGRFPQYAQYRTFRDAQSVNHGELGAKILKEKKILADLPVAEQELIIQAVKFHNAFSVPHLENPDVLPYLKLVRDADKLDIFRVYIENLEASPGDRASAALIDLEDAPGFSPEVLARILERKMVSISLLKNVNDFMLLQLSWAYDINYAATLRAVIRRGYLEWLISHLPDTEEVREVVKSVTDHIEMRIEENERCR